MTALAETRSAITPKVCTSIRQDLKEHIDDDRPFTLSSLARRNRIHPRTFIGTLHDAAQSEEHPLHRFSLDVFEAWAIQEERWMHEGLIAAKSKNDWSGWMTYLERVYRDEFVKPSEAAHMQPQVHIGFVEQMALVQGGSQDALPTAD